MFKFLRRRELKKQLKAALADGQLTAAESQHLLSVASDLGFDKRELDDSLSSHFKKQVAPILARIQKTRRMNALDEAEIIDIAGRLGIQHDFDHSLQMCRELSAYESGEEVYLPAVDAPIILAHDEVCCLSAPSSWMQMKTIKTRIGSKGFSTSIRIMKGVSYRIGTYAPVYSSSDQMVVIDSGDFCITNKRVAFRGDQRSTSIKLGRILDLEPHSDGIEIHKSTGKPDAFKLAPIHAEYAAMALSKILNG